MQRSWRSLTFRAVDGSVTRFAPGENKRYAGTTRVCAVFTALQNARTNLMRIVLLGAPFAFLVGTRGAIGGLALAVGIGIVYWAIAALFEAMGSIGQLPPLLAAWSPDAIFGFLAVYFFLRVPT